MGQIRHLLLCLVFGAYGLPVWTAAVLTSSASGQVRTDPKAIPDDGIQEAVESQMGQLVRTSVNEFFVKAGLAKPVRIDIKSHVEVAVVSGQPVIKRLKLDVMLNTDQPPATVREARQAVLRTLRGNGYRAGGDEDDARPEAILTVGVDPESARAGHNGWRQYGAFAALVGAALAFLALMVYLLSLPIRALSKGTAAAAARAPGLGAGMASPQPPPVERYDPGLGLPLLPRSAPVEARAPRPPAASDAAPAAPRPGPARAASAVGPAPSRLPPFLAPLAPVPVRAPLFGTAPSPSGSLGSVSPTPGSARAAGQPTRPAPAVPPSSAASAGVPPPPPKPAEDRVTSAAAGLEALRRAIAARGLSTPAPAASSRTTGSLSVPRPPRAAPGSGLAPPVPDPLDPQRVSRASPQALRQAFNRLPFEKALTVLARLDPAARQSVLAKLELQEPVRARLERELAMLPPGGPLG